MALKITHASNELQARVTEIVPINRMLKPELWHQALLDERLVSALK